MSDHKIEIKLSPNAIVYNNFHKNKQDDTVDERERLKVAVSYQCGKKNVIHKSE